MKISRYLKIALSFAFCNAMSSLLSAQSPAVIKQPADSVTFNELYRPKYHLTTPMGALFDPTALVYTHGKYQVNKGIASSTDLIHWKHGRAQRLSSDTVREMSGSAVIDSLNTSGFGLNGQPPMVAVYSGLRVKDGMQFQCIAYSNDQGITWTPYQFNPVIDIHSTEFRDPQVFWYAKTQKWVMVVALAAERKIRFYESKNLKEWKFLSDFGPYGAVNGVWECPDFFRLPVKGAPDVYKWVLEVSVQPISGQYFVGDFDGKVFRAEPGFLKNQTGAVPPSGKIVFDFETDLAGWKVEGNAFSASPAKGSLPGQNAVLGYNGKQLVNSFNPGDKGTGKLTSPEFIIDHNYLNFLLGGGMHERTTCVNLLIDGKAVRTKTGTETEALYWTGWDVAELKGKKARLEVVDKETGGFGHIMIDQVMLCDQLAKNEREPAFWLDYGPDFYAVRSWVNGPQADNRRISIAWLGSWLYATKVPTRPWKGGHSFPRNVELVKTSQGIRLIQNPVKELSQLREKHIHLDNLSISAANQSLSALNLTGNSYELEAEFELTPQANLQLQLCANQQQKTLVGYGTAARQLTVDRTLSGVTDFSPSFPEVYSAPLKLKNNRLKLHILIDQSSIEVFGNDGVVSLTCQIFPDAEARGINLNGSTGNIKLLNLDLWELKPIW